METNWNTEIDFTHDRYQSWKMWGLKTYATSFSLKIDLGTRFSGFKPDKQGQALKKRI